MIVHNAVRALRGLHRLVLRLRTEQRGNVLMLVGLSILPLTFATGMGIDYSRAMRLQTKLNAIADAASLASTTTPMLKQPLSQACAVATRTFVSQAGGLDGLSLDTSNPSQFTIGIVETYASQASVTATCSALTSTVASSLVVPLSRVTTVSYHGTSANAFGGILKMNTLPISGTSASKVAVAPYINIHLALDTSQSMGLAATTGGAITLWNETLKQNGAGRGCQFGCHVVVTSLDQKGKSPQLSNEQIAEGLGVQLRVDVLRNATTNMIQTAQTDEKTDKLYKFAIYQFGQLASSFSALTDDLTKSANDTATIDLGPNTSGGLGDTNLPDMLSKLSPSASNVSPLKIAIHGDGTTVDKARAFVFIITDGVTDLCGSNHCTAPIDPTQCQAFKDNSVTVGVVYTTFLPILQNPNNGPNSTLESNYVRLVQTFSNAPGLTANDIAPRLQACASPGWYFEASDGPTIQAAMQKLFTQASQTPTLTR